MPSWTLDFSRCPCRMTRLAPATPCANLPLPLKHWTLRDSNGKPAILLHPCRKHLKNPLSKYRTTNSYTKHISNLEIASCPPHTDSLPCRPKVSQQMRIQIQYTVSSCTPTPRQVDKSFLQGHGTRRFENGISLQGWWNELFQAYTTALCWVYAFIMAILWAQVAIGRSQFGTWSPTS